MVSAIPEDIAVMIQGADVEPGAKDEVFSVPQIQHTRLLLAAAPARDRGWLTPIFHDRNAILMPLGTLLIHSSV